MSIKKSIFFYRRLTTIWMCAETMEAFHCTRFSSAGPDLDETKKKKNGTADDNFGIKMKSTQTHYKSSEQHKNTEGKTDLFKCHNVLSTKKKTK